MRHIHKLTFAFHTTFCLSKFEGSSAETLVCESFDSAARSSSTKSCSKLSKPSLQGDSFRDKDIFIDGAMKVIALNTMPKTKHLKSTKCLHSQK